MITRLGFSALLLLSFCAPNVSAGGRTVKLVVDAEIDSREQWSDSRTGESGQGASRQEMHLSVIMKSDGVLSSINLADRAGFKLAADSGDERFMTFAAYQGCTIAFRGQIDTRREGRTPDVQGMVPFREEVRADYAPTGQELANLCTRLNPLVLDVKTSLMTVTMGEILLRGNSNRIENGRKVLNSSANPDLRLDDDAMQWIRKRLRSVARTGTEATTIERQSAHGEKHTGATKVRLIWRLEDVRS